MAALVCLASLTDRCQTRLVGWVGKEPECPNLECGSCRRIAGGRACDGMLARWWILDCAAILPSRPRSPGGQWQPETRLAGWVRGVRRNRGVFHVFEVSGGRAASSPIILVHPTSFVSLATGQCEGQIGQKVEQGQTTQGKSKCDTEIRDVKGDVWVAWQAWKRIACLRMF